MESGPKSSLRLLDRVKNALAHSAAAQSVRGRIRLEVLFSVPRQARDLYPHAHVDAQDASKTARSHSVEAYVEQIFMTASYTASQEDQPRLMYALECFLYTLPKQRSAVLYVSKLDSSGWGPTLPPKHLKPFLQQPLATSTSSSAPLEASTSITRVITEAFVRHFASLDHWAADDRLARIEHLSLHILARAQGAYLFPSSNENKTKHILTDGQLIKWWRSVVTSVAERAKSSGMDVRSYYVIPGYDRLESHQLVPLPDPQSGWVYGHPYSHKGAALKSGDPLPPLPLAGPHSDNAQFKRLLRPDHIATLLPHFPDDPKSRFIAELARDAHEHASSASVPPAKRRAVAAAASVADEASRPSRSRTPSRRSATPSTPPPSARLTRSGSRSATSSPSPVKLTSSQRQSMRERLALDQVTADEFWTRMAFRQECCSGNAVGVFVALFTRLGRPEESEEVKASVDMTRSSSTSSSATAIFATGSTASTGRSMVGQPLSLPRQILQDIIFKRLMIDDCDWSKADASVSLTHTWEQAIGQALQRKGNLKGVYGEEKGEVETHMDPTEVGRGIIWDTVDLNGPTQEDIANAEAAWIKQGGTTTSSENGQGSTVATVATTEVKPIVNVLSVKRKKKV